MRITDVRTVVVGNPWKNWLFVIVETDEGLRGLGEATGAMMTRPFEAAVHEVKDLIVGEDPCRVHHVWEKLFKALYLPNHQVPLRMMAGIETACWDILAKRVIQPLHHVLGGRLRDRVPIYANGWYQGPREPAAWAGRAREAVARGYRALKFDPFGTTYRDLPPDEERLTYRIIEAVRAAVGPEVQLMIEAHDRFDTAVAVRIGRWPADFDVAWYEAPVVAHDVEALASVARQVPVPVATGERFTTLTDFARLLGHDVVSIIQPEPLQVGGIWRTLQVAGLCEAFHASLAPHNSESPLKTLVNAHIAAVVPNFLIQEVFDDFLEPCPGGRPRCCDHCRRLPRDPGRAGHRRRARRGGGAPAPLQPAELPAAVRAGLGDAAVLTAPPASSFPWNASG